MTLEQAIAKIEAAIAAAIKRKNIEHFDNEKNIYELHFAIDYALDAPKKSERIVK